MSVVAWMAVVAVLWCSAVWAQPKGSGRWSPEIRFIKGEVRGIQWLSEGRMAERLNDARK